MSASRVPGPTLLHLRVSVSGAREAADPAVFFTWRRVGTMRRDEVGSFGPRRPEQSVFGPDAVADGSFRTFMLTLGK